MLDVIVGLSGNAQQSFGRSWPGPRHARVVAVLPNPDLAFRPGAFVTAEIPLSKEHADVVVPKSALQTIKGATVREVLDSTVAPEAAAGLSQPSSLQSSLVLVSSIWITSDPASTHLRSA